MRKSWDEVFLNVAREFASMGTCARRQVGCVLVDDRNNVISTGMNGVPPKWEHCRENDHARCPGAEAKSGTMLDECWANHAEQNALGRCSDRMRIHTCYTTTSPCVTCVKELLHTGCVRIVFIDEYSQPSAKKLWTMQSLFLPTRTWVLADHRTWERFDYAESMTIVVASSENK